MSWHQEIERALAELRADSEEQASDAAAALGWLVGEEGPERLSEGRLQEFLWSVLPSRFLMPIEFQLGVAVALARALDALGLHRYADVCRDPRVEEILRAWERSETAGIEATRRALASSSVEPPDVGDLHWGAVMGSWESRALEELSAALELAVQAGEVRRAGRGSKEARRAFAWEWMQKPRPGFEPMSPYEWVVRERLESWFGRRPTRRRILEPLAELLASPVAPPAALEAVVWRLQWLLREIGSGAALTATGNLSRALVRRAVDELGWRVSDLFEATGEIDVPPLGELHRIGRSMRAIRHSGRKVILTRAGSRWATDGEGLWRALARHLTEGERWEAAVAELGLTVLLTEEHCTASEIASRIAPALVGSGWRERGRRRGTEARIDGRATEAAVWSLVNRVEVLGMVEVGPWDDPWVALTEPGRTTALEAIRARAIAPRISP